MAIPCSYPILKTVAATDKYTVFQIAINENAEGNLYRDPFRRCPFFLRKMSVPICNSVMHVK